MLPAILLPVSAVAPALRRAPWGHGCPANAQPPLVQHGAQGRWDLTGPGHWRGILLPRSNSRGQFGMHDTVELPRVEPAALPPTSVGRGERRARSFGGRRFRQSPPSLLLLLLLLLHPLWLSAVASDEHRGTDTSEPPSCRKHDARRAQQCGSGDGRRWAHGSRGACA